MRVHGAGGDLRLDAPHVRQQHLAGLHPAAALQEGAQQAELERGEDDLLALHADLVARGVQLDVSGAQLRSGLILRVPSAAQHRPDPEHQLADGEGLHHVVIRAGLEALDAVGLLALGADDDHRHLAQLRVALEHPEHLAAGHVREHQVQQHQIRRPRASLGQASRAGVRRLRLEPRGPEVVLDESSQVLLVLDDQDARHASSTSRSIVTAV